MQNLASNATDSRMATAMTVISVALLAILLVHEAKDLFKTDNLIARKPVHSILPHDAPGFPAEKH